MSGLDWQVAPIAFTQGLDTRTQRKLVVPGKWDTLINVSLASDYTLKRRDGFEAVIDGQAGNGLLTRNDELVVVNGPALTAIDAVTQAPAITRTVAGKLPYVDVSKFEVDFNQGAHDMADMAYGNGYACYVWRGYAAGGGTVSGTYVTLIDMTSGVKLIARELIDANDCRSRVVFADNAFFIISLRAGLISCAVIATSAPSTIGTFAAVLVDANITLDNFDACKFNGNPLVAFIYNDGVTSVQAAALTRVGTVPTMGARTNVITEANVTNASIQGMACQAYASDTNAGIFVLHTAGGALAAGLVGAVLNTALAVSTGATALSASGVPAVASACHVTATAVSPNMHVFWDNVSSYGAAALRPLSSIEVSSTLVASGSVPLTINSACFTVNAAQASGPQGPFIAGKAFTSGGTSFLPVAMLENYFSLSLNANTKTLNEQNAFFLIRCNTPLGSVFSVVAGALYQTHAGWDPTGAGTTGASTGMPTIQTPCSTPALASGFGVCLQEYSDLQLTNGFNTSPIGLSHLTLTPRTATPGIDVQLAESTYTSGGQLGNYDGQQIVQHGFPMFPEGASAVVSAPGGGTKLTVGVHQVCFVYEWLDAAGNRHQSAPSIPISVTVANATDQINCLVPTTQLPQSSGWTTTVSTLNIVGYMTVAGGMSFYRAITSYTPVQNNVAATTVAYTIGAVVMTDDRLATNELLYTQPLLADTTLPNIAPGPMSAIAVSQQRVWGFQADQPLEYTFSQEPVPNTGLQFNPDGLGGILPADSGGGVAISRLDEKTILLGARKLYVVYGTGPTSSGGFNNFSDPQEIPSDVGCSEARSVLLTPKGIIFKSLKGWYLLGRDLSVSYIGAPVARYDSFSVTSAVMIENQQEVRITSESTSCPTLVYSYDVDSWSTFYMGNLLHPGAITDAVWWAATENWVHLHPSTTIFPGLMQDTPGVYIDGAGTASPIGFFIYGRTGWFNVGHLEGFQRVRRLYLTATSASAPTTTLSIGVSFDDAYTGSTGAYSVSTNLSTISFASVDAIDIRHKLARMKCKSVAFTFSDGNVDETKVPLTGLQVIGLEVGLKRGVNKLASTQTVG